MGTTSETTIRAALGAAALVLAAASFADVPATPQLAATTLAGDTFRLADRRGHVVLIHFWATWCAPCREEMPVLDAFYKRYRDRGVDVIGISVDRGRDLPQVREAMRDLSFPAAMVKDARPNDFGAPNALPVTYVIDPQGRVSAQLRPDSTPLTQEDLARVVEPLLAPR